MAPWRTKLADVHGNDVAAGQENLRHGWVGVLSGLGLGFSFGSFCWYLLDSFISLSSFLSSSPESPSALNPAP